MVTQGYGMRGVGVPGSLLANLRMRRRRVNSPLIHSVAERNCLENRFGSRIGTPRTAKRGRRRLDWPLFAAKDPSLRSLRAIFQTVSEEVFSETRSTDASSHYEDPHLTRKSPPGEMRQWGKQVHYALVEIVTPGCASLCRVA
jgi:hypothetical protein